MGKKLDIFLEKNTISLAENLLLENNKSYHDNQFTIPSKNLYPHQWSWDSGWISYDIVLLTRPILQKKN